MRLATLTREELARLREPMTWTRILGTPYRHWQHASKAGQRWREGIMRAEEAGLVRWLRATKEWVLTEAGIEEVERG